MKRLNKKTTLAVIAALCFTSLLSLFYSCEIGLGSAVDVEPPSLTIDSPEVDSVIRDVFAVKGRWSDDGSISSIKIELSRPDGLGKTVTINGDWSVDEELKDTGTWKAIVDYKKENLADGTYQVIAKIKDKGSHETTQSTTFTLDNTAPVLILNKPNSAPGETPSVYGQRLYLQGNIADTAKQTFIEVDFYSDEECTNLVLPVTTDPISPTDVNSNNAKLATFLDLNYDTIYGTLGLDSEDIAGRKKGSKALYVKFKVYDNAVKIPVYDEPTEEDKKGNVTETVYFSRDLSDSITKRKTSSGGFGLAPIDIYNILNGTEELKDSSARSITQAEINSVVEILKTKEQKISYITIDPDNNPYFTISGLNTLSLNGNDFEDADNGFQIKNGSQILEVSVFMGNDSIELATNNEKHPFYAYLLECDKDGKPLKEDKEENRIKLYSKVKDVEVSTEQGSDKHAVYAIGGKQGHKTTDGAYVFNIPVSKTIKSWSEADSALQTIDMPLVYGKNYLIRVNGVDNEDNPIVPNGTGYGFKFMSNDSAPTLTITEPATAQTYNAKDTGFYLKGSVKSVEGIPSVEIFLNDGTEEKLLGSANFLSQREGEANEFEYTIEKGKFDQNQSKQYLIRITATRGTAPVSVEKTIFYDVEGPEITIISETPVVEKDADGDAETEKCINGVFQIKGSVSDEFDRFGEASYRVVQGETEVTGATALTEKFTINIDTKASGFTDEAPATVIITAKDRAGNETKLELEYFVSQKTDKPVISNDAENINLEAAQYSDITTPYNAVTNDYYNMFQRRSNLYLNVQDDDGLVKNVTVDLQMYTTSGDDVVPAKDDQGNDIKEETKVYESKDVIQYSLPDAEGIYFAQVKAYDRYYDFNNPDESENNHNFTKAAFFLKVTGNGPDVELKPQRDYISTKDSAADLTIKFVVADVGNGPYTVYMDDGSGNRPLFSGAAQTSPFEYTLNYVQGDTNAAPVKFTVKDKFNVGTEKNFTPKFDNVSPQIEFSNGGYPATPELTEDKTFFFKGTLNDPDSVGETAVNASGVEEVYIRFVSGEFASVQEALSAADAGQNPAVSTQWIKATSTLRSWNYEAEWAGDALKDVFESENKKTVIVKAIDGAGNTAMDCKSFTYDTMVPEITEISTTSGKDYINGESVEVKIKYCDTNPAGKDSAQIRILDILGKELTETGNSVSITLAEAEETDAYPVVSDGKKTRTITATIPFPKTQRKDEGGNVTSNDVENGTYKIKVKVYDDNGRASRENEYQVTRDDEDPTLDNIDLATSSQTNRVYNDGTKYFVNNLNQKFTISGVAKDNIGVEGVKLELKRIKKITTTTVQNETAETTETIETERNAAVTRNTTTQIWSFADINFDTDDWKEESTDTQNETTTITKVTGACAVITATDKAGNAYSQTRTIIFDTQGPVGKHEVDGKEKDLYVRIGDDDNDEIVATETNDKKVGKKYSNGSYGNDVTIQLRGNFDDGQNGSGVSMIYYKVYATEAAILNELTGASDITKLTPENLDELKDKVIESPKAGKFAPLDEKETKRVFYNVRVTKATDDKDSIVAAEEAKGGTWFSDPSWKITDPLAEGYSTQVGYYKFSKLIETSFNTSITGLAEGNNFVVFVAQDNIGNAKVDYAVIPKPTESNPNATEIYPCYSLNVDTVVPQITSDHEDDIIFTNGEGSVELSGTVFDADAGIRSLEFFIGNTALKEKNGDVTVSLSNGNWTATIPAAKFSGSATSTVYLLATDDAGKGNSTKSGVATVKIDKIGPKVLINSPVKDSIVNKTITLKGSVDDGNGAGVDISTENAPRLFWTTNATEAANNPNLKSLKTKASEGWVELIVDDNNKSWDTTKLEGSFNVDTKTLKIDDTTEVPDGTTAYFTVSATDLAGTGNVGYAAARSLIIDQNSDRPVIKFTNVNLATISGENTIPMDSTHPIWIKKQEIWGSVSDDDGEVKSVEISFDNKATWTSCWTAQDGLSYTFPSDGSKDGSQNIYFKVVDAKDTTFISSVTAIADTSAPMLAYQSLEYGNTAGKYSTVLYANVDLKEPSIPCLYYSTEDFSSVSTESDLDALFDSTKLKPADTTKWKELSNLTDALGGDTKDVYILIKAKDANSIKEIKTIFGTDELTVFKESEGTVSSSGQTEQTKAALYKIDISSIGKTTVEKKKIEVSVKDAADHSHDNSYTIEIDNVPPTVDIDSPSANAELYGTAGVAQTSVTVRGRTSDSSDVQDIYLAVTKGENEVPAESGVSAYKSIKKRSALSWTAVFNGNSDTSEDVYYTDLFNSYIDALYGEEITTSVSQKDICLWLYAVDKLGNSGKSNPVKLPLTILTQGDKPIVSITYPTKESKVGGVITITGSTSIATNEVDKIFVQIDPNYNHDSPAYDITQNQFANDWETSLQTLIDTATEADKTIEYSVEDIKNSENTVVARGILAGGSKQSWNVILNAASEFNTEGNRDIAVRAYAISKSNKVSEPVITWFTLDPDSPTFGNNDPLTLVQYSNNTAGTGSITASMLYTPGMWIQGKWWLTGSVEDESGIDYVKLNGTDLESQYYVVKTTPYKGRKLNIPVGNAIDSETVYGPTIKLVTKETGGEKTSTADIKLYYDNKPPVFESTTLKADQTNTLVQSDGVCEIKGILKELGDQSGFKRIAFYVTRTLNSTNYVTDVMKAQGTGTENCYTQGSLLNDGNLYWQTAANCTAKNGIEIEVPQDDVPAFARTGGLCRINDVIYTIKSITAGANGIKIVTIDSKIDNGTVNIDFALAQVIDNTVSELGITTYFGDTTHEITNDDGDEMVESYKESSGEWTVSINSKNIKDGTIQIHFVAYDQAGNKTYKTYNAIVANNAPRIAGVKFGTDINGSGEVEESELRTGYSGIYAVEGLNKKPNITVNGQAANGVKISKLALPNNGTDVTAIDNTKNSVMTVKGAIKVIPEVVGGNNGLSWTYSVNGTNKSSAASLNNTHSGNDDIRSERETTISIDTLTLLKDISSDGNTVLGFTIWDKTEGTTPGTDSNKAELLLKVNVELRDETPPTAGIKPFYWDSIPIGDKNNSSVVYKDGIAFGHIELEKDLPETGFDYNETDREEFDLDPKVSGVIYLEGFAKDNVAVEKLYLKFPGLSDFDEDFGLVAKRDREENSETKGQIISEPKFAEKGIELVSAAEELVTEGDKEYNLVHWKLKIDTSRIDTSAATNVLVQIKAEDRGKATIANGGSGYNYQGAKQSDVPTTFVLAKNQTGYKLGEDGNVEMSEGRPVYDSENQTPSYRIDVVPYIAKVYTSLASLKKNNWSVYNRTALGHYSVASDGTAYLYGFNLGNADKLPNYGSQALAVPADGSVSNANYSSGSDYAAYKVVTFPISNEIPSGQISLKVNDVETLNNKNNNEARGSYTGSVDLETNPTGDKNVFTTYYYNRQPNGDNNNRLTDDIEIDIWEIDPTAAVPFEGKGRIAQPIMKINPVTDQLGFAFANSSGYFSMAGKTLEADADTTVGKNAFFLDSNKSGYVKTYNPLRSYSYTYWSGELNAFSSIGFAYDKAGNSYGTAAGGNLNVGQAKNVDFFFFTTDKWGKAYGDINKDNDFGRHKSSKPGINAIRLEKTGLATTDSGNLFDAKRIHSPSIVTASHDAGDTSVYLAYYDAITDTIRYRAGNLDNSKTINEKYYEISSQTADSEIGIKFVISTDAKNEIGDCNVVKVYDSSKNVIAGPYMIYNYVRGSKQFNLVDSTGTKVTTAITDAKYIKLESANSKGNFGSIYDRWDPPVINKNYANVDNNNAESNYDYITILAGGSTLKKASDYFALGVIPGETYESDVVVAVWYSENTLWYSYNTTPTQDLQNNTTAAGWTTPISVFKDTLANAGEYCQITVDEAGGVHIAALDSSQSDLVYAYLPSSFGGQATSTNDFKTCIVDSNGTVGDSLTIDVAFDKDPACGGIAIPSISYYSSAAKRPKVAHLVKKSNDAPAGAISEEFTGYWESSVIPTTSTLDFSDTNRVNVGVWKDEDGILKDNPSTGDKVQSKDYLTNYYYGVSYGIKFGNGTSNAILGYAIKKDASTTTIETAQMR